MRAVAGTATVYLLRIAGFVNLNRSIRVDDTGQNRHIHAIGTSGETGLGRSSQRRARGHHVIDQKDMTALYVPGMAGVNRDGAAQVGKARLAAAAVLLGGAAVAVQQIRHRRASRCFGERRAQKRGLVVAALEKPCPMQRHRRNQRVRPDQRRGSAGKPAARGKGAVMAVMVFQTKDNLARFLAVKHDCAAPVPRAGDVGAVVADQHLFMGGPPDGRAAFVADRPGNKGNLWPALRAQCARHLYIGVTGQALRGVKHACDFGTEAAQTLCRTRHCIAFA